MKRSIGLIVLLIVLVLAVAFYVIAMAIAKREEEKNEVPEETLITIVEKESSDVAALTFQSEDLTFSITTTTGGSYRLATDDAFPLDQAVASYMAKAVSLIAFHHKLDAAELNPAEYGLDDPKTVITVSYSDDTSLIMKLGDYNKYADSYYCDIGDGAIYLIDSTFLDSFDYSMQDLLQDETIPKPTNGLSSVTAIELAYRDGSGFTYTLGTVSEPEEAEETAAETGEEEEEPAAVWIKTLADGTVVDGDFTETVEALYKELFEAKLDEWADYNVTGSDRLGAFGLAEPAVTVTVRYQETVTISGDDSSSSVTKDVEKVVGFLIGDALPIASDKEDTTTEAPESDAETTDASSGTDQEAAESEARRYFMLEGSSLVYILDEADLAGALGIPSSEL